MELICDLHADLTLTATLEMRHSELMLIIASLQCNWLALEAIAHSLLLTVIATKTNDPMLLTFHTVIIPVLRSRYIRQDMIFTAFEDDGSLLVNCDALAVSQACLTEPCVTNLILIVDFLWSSTSHTTIILLFLSKSLEVYHIIPLKLVLKPTCSISIHVYQLAANAISLSAVWTPLRTFLMPPAQLAFHCMVECIDNVQFGPTRAMSIDIGNKFSRLRLVKFIRQLTKTPLAYAEVTQAIIIYPVITHCCADSTDITDKVEIGDALKGKLMSQRTTRFSTGRDPASHTVILVTDPAKRPAKFGLSTCHT